MADDSPHTTAEMIGKVIWVNAGRVDEFFVDPDEWPAVREAIDALVATPPTKEGG